MEEPTTYSFQTLDNPADPTFNQLLGINDKGLIVGFYGNGDPGHPNQGYLLKPPTKFTPVDFPGVPQTQLTGLNNNGIAVGYFYPTNNGTTVDNQFGFYVKDGAFTTVNNPKTPSHPNQGVLIENQLLGVNDHNIAVGFYNDAFGNSHGYTYNIKTNKFSADINDPHAVSTVAAAINNKRTIAGFYTDKVTSVIHGFLDNHGVFKTVDAPGATATELLGLNDHGIAVGEDIVGGVTHGIIYNSKTGKFTTLDDPNAVGSTVFNGINNKGDIVGFYSDTAGNTHGLLAVPDADTVAKAEVAVGLLRQHIASAFVTTSDGHGGTLITDPSLTSNQNTFLTQPHHG